MINYQISIIDATKHWVRSFNAFPQPMISLLFAQNPDSWHELTLPAVGDSVFVYEFSQHGEITFRNVSYYSVSLLNGNTITLTSDDFEVYYDYPLPIWGTLWSFDDSTDISYFEIHDSWSISEVDKLIEINGYEFSPALSYDDKKLIFDTMAKNYDSDIGYNFKVLDSILHSLFAHRLINS